MRCNLPVRTQRSIEYSDIPDSRSWFRVTTPCWRLARIAMARVTESPVNATHLADPTLVCGVDTIYRGKPHTEARRPPGVRGCRRNGAAADAPGSLPYLPNPAGVRRAAQALA